MRGFFQQLQKVHRVVEAEVIQERFGGLAQGGALCVLCLVEEIVAESVQEGFEGDGIFLLAHLLADLGEIVVGAQQRADSFQMVKA